MTAQSASERDALLPKDLNEPTNQRVGPLEISTRTRWGILAGIWTATFLSVCSTLFPAKSC